MIRSIQSLVWATLFLTAALLGPAEAADLKVIQTHRAQNVTVTLRSDAGHWTEGKNSFVLEFTSTADKKPVDVGTVALSTSMPMPGMAPMVAGATLTPDKTAGRYLGTISFPDRGARQVTVTWDGPAGKGSARFSVPVR
jgi:YtkA-like